MTYDLIIIGGGPAGCAAAVYAARKRLKTALIAYEFGGQSNVSENIQNWIGTPSISGIDFAMTLKKHVQTYAEGYVDMVEGEVATLIDKVEGGGFMVSTDAKKSYLGKTLLITSGSGRRKLEIPGAKEFENKGITYCASCDGPLFADQDVVVIGGGNAAFETAAQLAAYCKSVTILHRSSTFKADEITVNKVLAKPNVKEMKNIELVEIKGEMFVKSIVFTDKTTGTTTELPVTGVFVEIGQLPNTAFVEKFLPLDENRKIVVNPMTQMTPISGVWAAGDATNGLYHQNNIAAGDAVKALEDIYLYLHAK